MWDWAPWGALGVAVVAGSTAIWLLVAEVRAAWRALTAARAHAVDTLSDFAAKAEAVAARLAARESAAVAPRVMAYSLDARRPETSGDTGELKASIARLRASLAQLAVLRAALDEPESAAGWVKALAPLLL